MKKRMLMFIGVLLFVCSACSTVCVSEKPDTAAKTPLQLVMIHGQLYYNTFEESTVDGRCGVMDGTIESTVDAGAVPAEDNQSNFGTDFDYQFTGDGVELVMDGKYIVFKPLYLENRFGVELMGENITATGMTLICTRADVLPEWEVTTGSAYGLSVLQDGTWKAYQRTDGICVDFAWTAEAYLITADTPLTWEIDWEWLYGELPARTYRLGKGFSAVLQDDEEAFPAYVEIVIV